AVRVTPGDCPGQRTAPVVADDVRGLGAGLVEEGDDVADELGDLVVEVALRPRAGGVAAQARGEDPQARVGQARGHRLPRGTVLRPAVEEHDDVTAGRAGVVDVEGESVTGEVAHNVTLDDGLGWMGGVSAPFSFHHRWTLPAGTARVVAVLADIEHYPRWWPQVRSVDRIDDESGRGRVRSLLPVTMHLVLTREIEDREGGRLRVALDGDLVGWAQWSVDTVRGDGSKVTVAVFEQAVRVAAQLHRAATLSP